MNPFSIVTNLISSGVSYFSEKNKIKAAITERKDELARLSLESKLEVIKRGDIADIEMDADSRNNAGWMDDVSFFVFLTPAVLAFYPPALPHIHAGFDALRAMPEWYQYALGMMLVSVWGYRKLVGPIIQSMAAAYLGKPPKK